MIMVKADPAASVAVNLGRENTVFVNPYNGEFSEVSQPLTILCAASSIGTAGLAPKEKAAPRLVRLPAHAIWRFLARRYSIYLWWPRSWQWRGLKMSLLFSPRLRGKARDWNWHNVIGFWSSSVLVVLTLTAAVMSYPWANDLLYTLTGSEPPRRSEAPAALLLRKRGHAINAAKRARQPQPRASMFY